MTRPIARFRPLDINRDLPPWELDETQWTDGNNIVFRDGQTCRVNGETSVFETVPATPFYLINAVGESGNYWVYPGADGTIKVTDGTTHKTIDTATYVEPAQPRNAFTGGTINGFPFINEPGESSSWGTTGPFDFSTPEVMIELPDAPVCRAMRAYDNFLIAMDTGDASSPRSEYQVAWSAAASDTVPSTWTPAATNLAGDAYLSATRGRIIDGAQLGPSFFIYKQQSAYRMTFVPGSPFVMDIELFSRSVGTLTRNCIAEFERNHIVLTDSDVVIHNGGTIRSLIGQRNRTWLFNQLGTNFDRAFVITNPIEREVWVCFPTGEDLDPQIALVWSADNDSWGVRDLNEAVTMGLGVVEATIPDDWDSVVGTWDAQTRIWNRATTTGTRPGLLKGNTSGMFSIDTEDDTLNAYIERGDLDFGDRNTSKTVRRVIPRLSAPTGTKIFCRVGKRDTTDVGVDWQNEVTYTTGTNEVADVFVTGKLLSFSFRSNEDDVWKLAGFDVEIETDRGNF